MTETCLTCRHHRVRFFSSPGARDGVAGTYSDRCMRLARDPDDPRGHRLVYGLRDDGAAALGAVRQG